MCGIPSALETPKRSSPKNDHRGFEILYLHGGVVRKYRPDFLVRLASGDMMVLETKGIIPDD